MKIDEQEKHFRSKSFLSSKILILTFLFSFGLLIFEFVVLPKSRISLQVLARHFSGGDYLSFLIILLLSLIAFAIFLSFVYVAFSSSAIFRVIYFLVFSILILTQYGYYKAFEFFPRFQEIEVALFSPNWEIFTSAIFSYFNFLALVPIIIFGIILLKTSIEFKRSWTALLIVASLFFGFFFATAFFTKNTFYVHSFNNGFRTIVSFPVIWYVGTINDTAKSNYYYAEREEIEYHSQTQPKNNIVFIVDESVRSDHLSLNGYNKPTTPILEDLNEKGFIKNYGIAVSGTTCSITSNALLLTGYNILPDREFRIFKLPTIFQYAKASNYKTYYFDGQVSTLWNGKPSDIVDFGKWITTNELNKNLKHKYDVDAEIARRVKGIINSSTGNFIWINKYGVHQSYINSYPNSAGTKEQRYDEALTYNLESFFKELSNDENFGKNTVYIYTSDHGRALGENKVTATHCSNTKPEASVPLMLLSTRENLPNVDTNFKASHSNIFATLLDLMNFPKDKRKYDYSISLLKAIHTDSQERFYYVGDLNKPEEGKKFAFDE